MLGFAIYSFEGIGVVMPIMQKAKNPKNFVRLLVLTITFLTCLYIYFGSICYLAYGAKLVPIITEMLPSGYFASILKIMFCVNLVFGYSICINPTN